LDGIHVGGIEVAAMTSLPLLLLPLAVTEPLPSVMNVSLPLLLLKLIVAFVVVIVTALSVVRRLILDVPCA
jgi:hypothetical protein